MIIVCQSIEHPNFPEYNNKWRVKNYWSYIVIKPHEDFDKVSFIKKNNNNICIHMQHIHTYIMVYFS